MKKNRILILIICIFAVTVFAACGKEDVDNVLSGYEQNGSGTDNANDVKNPSNDSKGDTVPQMTVVPDAPESGEGVADKDDAASDNVAGVEVEASWEDAEAKAATGKITADTIITLNGDSISVTGRNVTVEGTKATITAKGSYLISGTLNDGQIIVDTQDEKKVELILNGVDITCSNNAPIYVISAPKKVVLELVDGSVNVVEDGTEYVLDTSSEDADNPSAAIYSKEDLEIKGEGTLYVTGNYNKGIFSKDDLTIESGNVFVVAADDGIRGKDSIEMLGGNVVIEAGADGFRTSNETDEGKGYITISGGTLKITAEQDAIQAVTDFTMTAGNLDILCGGGSANASTKNDEWGQWGGMGGRGGKGGPGFGGFGGQQSSTTTTETDEASAKAIKAAGTLTISGGNVTIDSSDDAIHSNTNVYISGGVIDITSGDDGMHADEKLEISAGDINITKSYEGIESLDITISGGNIKVTASDDGLNAAGGNDASALGGRPGQNMFGEGDGMITISGGRLIVNAAGDGIDSNKNVVMTDGFVMVYGPTNSGNGPLDYGGTFKISGGTLMASGSAGMAQSVTGEGQAVLSFKLTMAADTILDIADSNGESLLTFASPKSYQCVIFSSPELKSGDSYKVSSGGSYTTEATDGIYSEGKYSDGKELGTLTAK